MSRQLANRLDVRPDAHGVGAEGVTEAAEAPLGAMPGRFCKAMNRLAMTGEPWQRRGWHTLGRGYSIIS
jgi:hypothetical protein